MTHISTITFPFSLFETLLNKPSKNLSKSKFSRYTTKIRGKLNFKLNFCKYFYRFPDFEFKFKRKKRLARIERKKRKGKKKDRASSRFRSTAEEDISRAQIDAATTPSFASGLRSGRAKTSRVVFYRETCPLPSTLSLWRGSSIEISFLPPSLPLPLARLPWKREVGGRGLDKFLANKERL